MACRGATKGLGHTALAIGEKLWPETGGLPPRDDQGQLPRRRGDPGLSRRWNEAVMEVDPKGRSGDRHWWHLLTLADSSGPEDETDEAYDERVKR